MNNSSGLHLVTKTFLPLLKGICYCPDELTVKEVRDDVHGFDKVVTIDPNVSDTGVMCGKGGRQINAIRRLVARAFERYGMSVNVRIVDSYKGVRRSIPPFKLNPNFDNESGFTKIFAQIINIVFPVVPRIERTDEPEKITIVVHADAPDVNALADAFWPFGKRQGKEIFIRTPQHHTYEHHTPSRAGSLSRHERNE